MSDKHSVLIRKVEAEEVSLLAELGLETFLQSHGHSASPTDIKKYTTRAFSENSVSLELADPKSIFHFLILGDVAIGYSKINFNTSVESRSGNSLCKLERIYLLSKYHGKGLGRLLMDHAIDLSKKNAQNGMWLYTWIENEKAVAFYQNYGFEIIGQYDFRISHYHVNPNHRMLLEW